MGELFLAFDTETIPNQLLSPDCIPQFNVEEDTVYGNAVKPEARERAEDRCRIKFNEKLPKKMSTDPALCQLVTFVGIFMDAETKEIQEEHIFQVDADDKHDDLEAVVGGLECIRKAWNNRTPIVTFNGTDFDFPVMRMRAMLQDVPVAPGMYSQLTNRYGSSKHYDLMKILVGMYPEKGKGLEFFLRTFGCGTKGDMDGSWVWPMYQAGKYGKIQDYGYNDVLTLAHLFCRVAPWIKVHVEGA